MARVHDPVLMQAKNALAAILRELNVARVVCIDDFYEAGQHAENIIGWCSAAVLEAIRKLCFSKEAFEQDID